MFIVGTLWMHILYQNICQMVSKHVAKGSQREVTHFSFVSIKVHNSESMKEINSKFKRGLCNAVKHIKRTFSSTKLYPKNYNVNIVKYCVTPNRWRGFVSKINTNKKKTQTPYNTNRSKLLLVGIIHLLYMIYLSDLTLGKYYSNKRKLMLISNDHNITNNKR